MSRLPSSSEIPDDHRRVRGVFNGVTEDGSAFSLEVRNTRRRMNSGEMMRQHIRSMTRGRPMSAPDLYKDVVEITLFVDRRRRVDIEVLPSGAYRSGRHAERSLKTLVETVLEEMSPRSAPKGP